MITDLRNAGMEVHDVDPQTKRQFAFADYGGHFSGSLDGCVRGVPGAEKTWHVLEEKTHNDESFKKLKKDGVQISKPMHFVQIQMYMGWSGMTRALYFAVNKNTDELYSERLVFHARVFEDARDRALTILQSANPPPRLESDNCVFCDHREACLIGHVPLVHCRTCLHAHPVLEGDGGRWVCGQDGHELRYEAQRVGCEHHLFVPALIGSPVEVGDGFVVYQGRSGYWANSTPTAFPAITGECLRSAELRERFG
jgi:hypothetical protein